MPLVNEQTYHAGKIARTHTGTQPKTEQISSGIILVVGPRAAHTRSLIQLKNGSIFP